MSAHVWEWHHWNQGRKTRCHQRHRLGPSTMGAEQQLEKSMSAVFANVLISVALVSVLSTLARRRCHCLDQDRRQEQAN